MDRSHYLDQWHTAGYASKPYGASEEHDPGKRHVGRYRDRAPLQHARTISSQNPGPSDRYNQLDLPNDLGAVQVDGHGRSVRILQDHRNVRRLAGIEIHQDQLAEKDGSTLCSIPELSEKELLEGATLNDSNRCVRVGRASRVNGREFALLISIAAVLKAQAKIEISSVWTRKHLIDLRTNIDSFAGEKLFGCEAGEQGHGLSETPGEALALVGVLDQHLA